MPRYFFDLSDGTHEADESGTELADGAEAQREAIRFLGEILKHEPERLADGTLRVDLHEERRKKLGTIEVRLLS